jgi:branched-chain amino acid aminotransferase
LGNEPVRTYEIGAGGVRAADDAADLGTASRHLPAGAYTTLRTYDRVRLLRLPQHLRRLEESSALQGNPGTVDEGSVRLGLRRILDEASGPESRLRLTFAPPRFFVSVERFQPLPKSVYDEGVACVTVDVHRDNPHAKDTRFIATAGQAYASLPPGVNEGLMLAEDGSVLEGLSSNFFAVQDGVLRTEGERVLAGVTRAIVLEVAAGVLPVQLTAVRRAELASVEECFLTSVSREVLPVVRIDGKQVGTGQPGAITSEIGNRFAKLIEAEAEGV